MKKLNKLLMVVLLLTFSNLLYADEYTLAEKIKRVRAYLNARKQTTDKTSTLSIYKNTELDTLPLIEPKPLNIDEFEGETTQNTILNNSKIADSEIIPDNIINHNLIRNNNNKNETYKSNKKFETSTIITNNSTKSYTYSPTNYDTIWVNGYRKNNGTYVEGHYKTRPNHTVYDNWSTKGNVNPYTGKKGYKRP